MTYRVLAETLRPIADRTAKYLRDDRGLRVFDIEEPIHDDVDRPTLHCVTRDHHTVCIEVCEGADIPAGVEKLVSDCVRLGLPVRMFLAVYRADGTPHTLDRIIHRAEQLGIGVIEVSAERLQVRREPVSLSLSGLRPVERTRFPIRFRQTLVDAEQTFRGGNPTKGCLVLYEEIERMTRKLAKKTYEKGLWQSFNPRTKPYAMNFETGAWAAILKQWMRDFDGGKTPTVNEILLARCIAVTAARNESGHMPKTAAVLKRRDERLRTRFEEAVDLMSDVIKAARPFRI